MPRHDSPVVGDHWPHRVGAVATRGRHGPRYIRAKTHRVFARMGIELGWIRYRYNYTVSTRRFYSGVWFVSNSLS